MRTRISGVTALALLATASGLWAQSPKAGDSRPVVACFGDSLTAGYGLEPGQSYPSLLQRELDREGYHYRVVNMGVSGETTQDGMARLQRVEALHPQIVILELGANDGLRGQKVSIAEDHLSEMIEMLTGVGAKVVLAGITLPPNYGPDYIPKFNAMFPELAKRYKVPLIPFLLANVATNPNLMQEDGLHPNAEGTKIVVQNVMKTIQPLLRK